MRIESTEPPPPVPSFSFQPRKPIRYKPRVAAAPRVAPAVALTLAAAGLIVDPENNVFVRLSFDRAISLAGFVPSQVTVDDEAGAGWAYAGTGVASLPDPQ